MEFVATLLGVVLIAVFVLYLNSRHQQREKAENPLGPYVLRASVNWTNSASDFRLSLLKHAGVDSEPRRTELVTRPWRALDGDIQIALTKLQMEGEAISASASSSEDRPQSGKDGKSAAIPLATEPAPDVAASDDLTVNIATIVTTHFSTELFEDVLIKQVSIHRAFPSGWGKEDALSRWYALGLICMTHCSMKSKWTEALTLHGGMAFYDAATAAALRNWGMSSTAVEKTKAFMRANVGSVTSSLRTIVDQRTKDLWFGRYAVRVLTGGNPPWPSVIHGQSDDWMKKFPEAVLSGQQKKFGAFLLEVFNDTANSIMAMVDSRGTIRGEQAIGSSASFRERELIQRVSSFVCKELCARYSRRMFYRLFGDRFRDDWKYEDAVSRWFALGLLALLASSMSEAWKEVFPDAKLRALAHMVTSDFMTHYWQVTPGEMAKVANFMEEHNDEISESLLAASDPKTSAEWFNRYTQRILGMNPPWDVRVEANRDGWDFELGYSKLSGLGSLFGEHLKLIGDSVLTIAREVSVSENDVTVPPIKKETLDDTVDPESYPSRERVQELWDTWNTDGEQGLLKVIRARGADRV